MNLHVRIILVLVLVGLVIVGFLLLRPTPERRVRRQLTALIHHVDKRNGEGLAMMALKMNSLPDLFAPSVDVQVQGFPENGTYTPEELASIVARARPNFSTIDLRFRDVTVNLESPDQAVVTATALLGLKTVRDETSSDTREMMIGLEKINGKWLFSKFGEVQVLKRLRPN